MAEQEQEAFKSADEMTEEELLNECFLDECDNTSDVLSMSEEEFMEALEEEILAEETEEKMDEQESENIDEVKDES